MMGWFDKIYGLFTTHPELFAGCIGILIPIGLSESLRYVYFPKDWTLRDQWKAIMPIDLCLSYLITHTLWNLLDKDLDSRGLLIVGSICFALATIAVHIFGVRFLLHKWPWIADPPA